MEVHHRRMAELKICRDARPCGMKQEFEARGSIISGRFILGTNPSRG